MIGKVTDFKTRKMLANAIWMSKAAFLIPVWGGCEMYLLRALQRQENKAARAVCRRGRTYRSVTALQQVGWLDMAGLVKYHSVLTARKVMDSGQPVYLREKLLGGRDRPAYATRLAVGGDLRQGPGMKTNLVLTRRSWRYRVRDTWSEIPVRVRSCTRFLQFKRELRKWCGGQPHSGDGLA